jgi:zinc transport system substrate-binding protein
MRGAALILVALALGSAGCARTDDSEPPPAVVASFYPLAWASEQVVTTSVKNVTPPGVEPHDVELTAGDVELIRDASHVVYVGGGFQPAVEEVVQERERPSLDVLAPDETDPHVWLDPMRFAQVVDEMGRFLGADENAQELDDALHELDAEFRRGLESCERRTLVTTHAAFGHLARRYALTQLSLTGTSPEAEPSPREFERLIDEVERSGATVVFTEPLVSDRLARTVAREAGLEIAELDPLESLSEERLDADEDYLSVMRDNLAALREGLGCR